jgi:hypothetical protein
VEKKNPYLLTNRKRRGLEHVIGDEALTFVERIRCLILVIFVGSEITSNLKVSFFDFLVVVFGYASGGCLNLWRG